MDQPSVMNTAPIEVETQASPAGSGALLRTLTLIALVLMVFRQSIAEVGRAAANEPEALHVWAAPFLIVILLWRRREAISAAATAGSPWGLLLIVVSLAALAMQARPGFPEYAARAAVIPALAGAIITAAGGRAAAICVPMLLLAWLTVPPSSPYVPALLVMDDFWTPELARSAVSALPNIRSGFSPDDILDNRSSETMLLMGMLSAAVFACAWRAREVAVSATIMILAIPVAVGCHVVRTVLWVVLEGQGWSGIGPLSARMITAAATLMIALGIFLLAARLMTTPKATSNTGASA